MHLAQRKKINAVLVWYAIILENVQYMAVVEKQRPGRYMIIIWGVLIWNMKHVVIAMVVEYVRRAMVTDG